jgi:AraC-like DNA-binding protein
MKTILIIGLLQTAFFSLLLITKKQKDVADYILALLFLLFFYDFGVTYVLVSDLIYRIPHLIGTASPLVLLLGPLLYFYTRVQIEMTPRFRARDMLHFIPYLADMAYSIPFFMLSGEDKISEFFLLVSGKPSVSLSVTLLLHSFSPIVYTLWSITVLTQHRMEIKNIYSYTTEKMKLDWMWYLTWSMFIVSICAFMINGIIVFSDVADWIQLRYLIFTIAVIWIITLGYYGVRRTSFFNTFPIDPDDGDDDQGSLKYEKSRLKENDVATYRDRLLEVMSTEKPYLDNQLTIAQLGKKVDVPPHHLSQVLNDHLDSNFFEFVNSYRVEEVKKRFLDPTNKNLTLLGIAMDSGFNSKASFNRIFKQMTNQTPTEYIKTTSGAAK